MPRGEIGETVSQGPAGVFSPAGSPETKLRPPWANQTLELILGEGDVSSVGGTKSQVSPE